MDNRRFLKKSKKLLTRKIEYLKTQYPDWETASSGKAGWVRAEINTYRLAVSLISQELSIQNDINEELKVA